MSSKRYGKQTLLPMKQDLEEETDSPSPEPVENVVFSELMQIRDQLKVQLSSLAERESAVKEREARMFVLEELVAKTQEELSVCIEQEVDKRTEVFQKDVNKLEEIVQQKSRDNHRLRSSFDTVRLANKNLKQQLDHIRTQNDRLETQLTNLQGRLVSLQRKMQQCDKTQTNSHSLQSYKNVYTQTSHSSTQQVTSANTGTNNELMSLLMTVVSNDLTKQGERSLLQVRKILQLSAQMLSTLSPSLESPYVQFVYSVLLQTNKQERSQLASTLRRIGQHLHQPSAATTFYKSPDLVVHTFSILVILATSSQVDVVCEVLQKLKDDLKQNEQCRELFLSNHGVKQLVNLTNPVNKVIAAFVVDIFLQLSVESVTGSYVSFDTASEFLCINGWCTTFPTALLPIFLKACATEEWFSMAALLLSHHLTVQLHTLEKLSILLQRLSKLKSSRRHFEGSRIPSLLQKLLATDGLQAQAPFLALNLQSTLMNLSSEVYP